MAPGILETATNTVKSGLGINAKQQQLAKETVEPTSNDRMTSDFGVKIQDTDHWLAASTGDKQGPALLEDNFAREKVNSSLQDCLSLC